MKELIKSAKDFKIIPNNFKSACTFDLIDVNETQIVISLNNSSDNEIKDYKVNSNVEIFGVNEQGLIYFETKIIDKNENTIILATTEDYSIIQRREYSRVEMNQGNVIFKDISPNDIISIEDISAGGLKLISRLPLELNRYYDIEIKLSNNMKINCAFSPIRVTPITHSNQSAYVISGKFVNLESTDRIILVQYTFKIKLEENNKEVKD